LFIGDSEVDIETAINAQVKVICVLWGFRDLEDIIKENPNYIVHKTSEILTIIGE
jgi:phosphoglycolate phosphatase